MCKDITVHLDDLKVIIHLVCLPPSLEPLKEDEDFVMMALAQNGMALGELKERCSDHDI